MTNAAEAIKTVGVAGPQKHAVHVVEAGAAMAAHSMQSSSQTCCSTNIPPIVDGELMTPLISARAS